MPLSLPLFGSLHSRSRDVPPRDIEIKLVPLSLAQLAGANEHEGRELKRRASDRHALVALDRPQQVTHTLGVSDRRHVPYQHRLQRTSQVGRWVAFRSAGRDRIPEHLTACLQRTMSRLDRAARFDSAHGLE